MKCIPDGWCSQNYRVRTPEMDGRVIFSTTPPFGMINDGHRDFPIEVAGKIKRRWELRDGETVVFSASKKLGLKRIVKIKADGELYSLFRKPGSEAMILEGPSTSACYQRVHFMTRRQKITGQWSDDRLVLFGFWFVAYYDQIDSAMGEVIAGVVHTAT